MPWKNSAGWTAGKQTETAAYNAAASAWASANGALYVDLFTPMGGGGGDPDVLAVAYDSGDLIHPNATGAGIIASLVGAQSP
jgi:lysophospholipase L1-like esterase